MYGIVSRGDIIRTIRKSKDLNNIINTNNKYILYSDEKQAEAEAEEIFKKKSKIKDIPVVDKDKKILFQYSVLDKKNEKYDMLNFLLAQNNEYYKTLCDFYNKDKICIIGDKDSIHEIVRFINKDSNGNMYPWNKVSCYSFENGLNDIEHSIVFCRNSFEAFYIKNKTKTNNILSIDSADAILILCLNEIYNLSQKSIDKCVELFSCTKVVFEGRNNYIEYLYDKLCRAGIQVCIKNNNMPMNITLTIAGDEIKCSLVKIVFNILYMMEHLCDMDSSLINKDYLFNMIDEYYWKSVCNKELFKIIFKNYNNSKFGDVIQKILQKRFNYLNTQKENYECITFQDIFEFIRKVLKFSGYRMIIEKYKQINNNIYCFVMDSYDKFKFFPYRVPIVYSRGENCCSDKFIDDISYESKYDLEDIIQQKSSIKNDRICTGYIKHESNYKSDCYSTNLYGDIRVGDECKNPYGKIYLLGPCSFSGYAVADYENVGSFLQTEIIKRGFNYKVINLSIPGCQAIEQYKRLLDIKINSQDIIIIDTELIHMPDEMNIHLDWNKVDKKMNKRSWYWDTPGHCSNYACKVIAGEIVEKIILEKKCGKKVNRAFEIEEKNKIKLDDYLNKVKNSILNNKNWKKYNSIGAIVMNCNPFTYGHRYLIETASRLVNGLLIFVVEEDKSVFPFEERYRMVKEGTRDLKNVVILPSGKFMISTVTFAGYFQKDNPEKASYDSFYDLKIFSEYIAPALKIKKRFVGEEPFDKVTSQYNKDMKILLGEKDIDVIEIPRLKIDDTVVNATYIRKCLEKKDWREITKYVPVTTMNILQESFDVNKSE